jgi:GNAT superfamily N-acetyltransferase
VLAQAHRSSAYPVHWPVDPARWLTPDALLAAWVAEVDGVVLGHIAIATAGEVTAQPWAEDTGRPVGQAAEITRLFVADAAQGRSVGRRLLDVACAEARERGRHPVLGVLDHNRSAIALYHRAGWRRLSSVDFPLSDDNIGLMHCYAAP